MKDQNGYLNGVAYPIEDYSNIVSLFIILVCESFAWILFYILYQIEGTI